MVALGTENFTFGEIDDNAKNYYYYYYYYYYYIFPSDKTLFPCFLHHQLPANPISYQLSRRECFYLLVSLIFFCM